MTRTPQLPPTAPLSAKSIATQEAIAAKVRRIVTGEYIHDAGGHAGEEEALVLLRYLRADRNAEAVHCHAVLIQRVREDLRTMGVTLPPHVQLINHLHRYCQVGNLHWETPHGRRAGRWRPYGEVAEEFLGRLTGSKNASGGGAGS